VKTILLATDGSPSARRATNTAVELAKATGWKLRVVAVWRNPIHTYGYPPMMYAVEIREVEREHAIDVLEETIEIARAAEVPATSELRQGEPVEEICAAAAEAGAALVVLGAHGWGPLRRMLFGSVSLGVLHTASCPVLVVREAPDAEDHEHAVVAAHAGAS